MIWRTFIGNVLHGPLQNPNVRPLGDGVFPISLPVPLSAWEQEPILFL